MTKLIKTNDYSIFKKHENNRQIDNCNLKRIMASIQSNNMLEFRPILVDKNMAVIDGQHRLEAAKKLGVEVYYQISNDEHSENIVLLNANQKNWGTEDYVQYYISKGNEDYKKLKALSLTLNISVKEIINYYSERRGVVYSNLKSGTLTFFSDEESDKLEKLYASLKEVIEILNQYVISNNKFLSSPKFRGCLIRFLKNPNVDIDVFKQKIIYKASAMRPCADIFSYHNMFRDVYNYRNANPID